MVCESYSDHAEPDHCKYEDTPKGYGYGHGESEYGGDKSQELRELRHKDGVAYGDRYELKELECEGEFESTMLEYEATEEPAYEPEYSAGANYGSYEPQGSERDDYETPQHGYKGTIKYVHPNHLPQVPATPIVYHNPHTPTMHYPTPMYAPSTPSFSTHTPIPHTRDPSHPNQ
jgi:hypothetical protein